MQLLSPAMPVFGDIVLQIVLRYSCAPPLQTTCKLYAVACFIPT